jgi:hypothetical protein
LARATAEVLYSLAHCLRHEDALAVREEISVAVGLCITCFVFEPDEYTGARNRVIVVCPAVLQSMYAPEFTAYSAGHRLEVEGN